MLLILSSCEDTLLEEPKGFIAPSQFFNTEAEVEAALYGVYDTQNDVRVGEFLWMFVGDFPH